MFGAEPQWACWRVNEDGTREPLFLPRNDLDAIRRRWNDLCHAEGLEPERVRKGRNELADFRALFVGDLIEHGAESTAIAQMLGVSRQRAASPAPFNACTSRTSSGTRPISAGAETWSLPRRLRARRAPLTALTAWSSRRG